MEQEDRQEHGPRADFRESRQDVNPGRDPEHQGAEEQVDGEDVHGLTCPSTGSPRWAAKSRSRAASWPDTVHEIRGPASISIVKRRYAPGFSIRMHFTLDQSKPRRRKSQRTSSRSPNPMTVGTRQMTQSAAR